MKRLVFWQLFVAALLLTGNSHAQSIKDLFNKENIEKAVNAVTGKSTADMTGTWSYTGSAIEFESDNLLQKAGGAVAATAAEKKLDEQLAKVGIKAGQMSFTFNADSTFSAPSVSACDWVDHRPNAATTAQPSGEMRKRRTAAEAAVSRPAACAGGESLVMLSRAMPEKCK